MGNINKLRKPRHGITEVMESKLFLSSISEAEDEKILLKNGIGTIISLCRRLDIEYEEIDYYRIQVGDRTNENIFKCFDYTFNIINRTRKPVLVNCWAGVSRAPTVVLAFLMKDFIRKGVYEGFEELFQFLKQKRNIIRPNESFIRQLKEYEKNLIQRKRDYLRRRKLKWEKKIY